MEKTYAKALQALASREGADPKKLVASLVDHLKAHGRLKLLPGILRELKRLELRAHMLDPKIEAASETELKAAISAAKKEGITAENVSVNPDLIRGWRARGQGMIVDHSGKRALIDLYRAITKHT